ncbi:glycine cleavage system protein GcvH [Gordonia sp. (in: high G+C Gram-positive bacteria)]|uniref:glycine cleavage system protein GcvH n=1 Tax=Gordonia sp. (in: high G+C Gram-positive bacteria) TaxID=84139 RepID=UPI001DCA616C|nr:glycine cleavage system protein GcvH [Gordonia sp. (in: high G+C Gram-positive bacteria)]MCB1293199.1 glycine cleavage system protein GcvH [Gordonia sp. (in: high G+C Gram-positive bacteria)]HMS75717.1 glycine cleavage system protein GcvH [Gordonia sp. (in: high G+C Gram-positive bacteria)]HQV18481.1 glycine cleavage system protein GcvH [Gordonia sp. (in: high G+C Gram-positive bacteria)]
MSESTVPDNLRYTAEHEWVQVIATDTVRVGITDYAQGQLGDVVFVQLPTVGDVVESGESFAEVESTKSVSDIYGPFAGTVAAVNADLDATPDLVNSDPYGAGWLAEITVGTGTTAQEVSDALLDADGYRAIIEN